MQSSGAEHALAQSTPSTPIVSYVTRAEVVTSLLRIRGSELPTIENVGQFPDVPKGEWYEYYLFAAERFGIVRADPTSHNLRPSALVHRAEFLRMVGLTFGLPQDIPFSFEDVSLDDDVAPFAGLVATYKLFPNDTDTAHLRPGALVSQQEALTAMRNFLKVHERLDEVAAEKRIAGDQSQGKLELYNVISTRRQKVLLAPEDVEHTPDVRRRRRTVRLQQEKRQVVNLTQLRQRVFELANAERRKAGVPPLTYNPLLEQSAQGYAVDMALKGYFSHVSPAGQTLRDRIKTTGYYNRTFSSECFCVKGYSLGENLARGPKTAEQAIKAWLKSPSHREAILNADYTDIGVGVSAGMWVQHFGGVLLPGKTSAANE